MQKKKEMRVLASRPVDQPELGKLGKSNKLTVLLRRSVSAAIAEQYKKFNQEFVNFRQKHGLELPPSPSTDANLAGFMDLLFLDCKPMNEGRRCWRVWSSSAEV